eukprot:12576358-Heterocapsa_arctica.AAC.1
MARRLAGALRGNVAHCRPGAGPSSRPAPWRKRPGQTARCWARGSRRPLTARTPGRGPASGSTPARRGEAVRLAAGRAGPLWEL